MKELRLQLTEPKEKGAVKGWVRVPLEEIKKALQPLLTFSSPESEAIIREKDQKIASLEQDNVALSEKAGKLDLFEEQIRTPEGFVEIARNYGYGVMLPSDKEALAGADIIRDPAAPDDPENWVHLENLGVWIRKKLKEA